MAIEQKQLGVAKELDDCLLALKGLALDLVEKKPLPEILANSFPKFVEAINGLDQVKAELEADTPALAATLGYRLGEIVGVILAKKAAPAELPPAA